MSTMAASGPDYPPWSKAFNMKNSVMEYWSAGELEGCRASTRAAVSFQFQHSLIPSLHDSFFYYA
jgi:hypothetical protein